LNDLFMQNGSGPPLGLPPVYKLSADGEHLVFYFRQEPDDRTELYARPVDASGPARLLSSPAAVATGPWSFEVSPTSDHLLFFDEQTEGVPELFANSITGDSQPWKLNGPFAEGLLSNPGFTPNGEHVVYHNILTEPVLGGLRWQPTVLHAYSTPIDGSSAPIELISDPEGPAVIFDRRISPDGSFVVFSIDNDGFFYGLNEYDFPDTHVLYAVPITGGVPRQITHRLGDGRGIGDFQIAPDSRSIIYLSNQDDTEVFELFSVPVVGLTLPGDYNGDGVVDTADYTGWRENDGSQEGYDTWRANFGRVAGDATFSNGTVPEPVSVLLLLLGATRGGVRIRRIAIERT
jgi:Tol biopolymer transport system component